MNKRYFNLYFILFYRSDPIKTFNWGVDTINTVRFNQTETNIFGSCGTDRTIILYDLRMNSPLTKSVLQVDINYK